MPSGSSISRRALYCLLTSLKMGPQTRTVFPSSGRVVLGIQKIGGELLFRSVRSVAVEPLSFPAREALAVGAEGNLVEEHHVGVGKGLSKAGSSTPRASREPSGSGERKRTLGTVRECLASPPEMSMR